MAEKTVKFYTQPGCGACMSAKQWLQEKGIAFEELDITQDEAAFNDLTQKYKSRGTPTLVIGDEVIVGFDRTKIEQALG